VTGNQPLLQQALMRLPWAQAPATRRRGTGHGRTESRWIKVIDLDGTDAHALFPHAPRAVKVIRRRRLLTALRPPTERAHALLGNWGRSTESPSARGASAPSLPPLSS